RIALAAGAAAELVVDAPRLVALGTDDLEPARGQDLLALGLALGLELVEEALVLAGLALTALGRHHVPGHLLGVAAEDDVGAAAGHVGRDGDGAPAAGLGHD